MNKTSLPGSLYSPRFSRFINFDDHGEDDHNNNNNNNNNNNTFNLI